MLHDVVEVKPLNNYELFIRFEDDLSGRVDIKKLITFTGIFSPLADEAYFKTVKVNPDLGTICWDNLLGQWCRHRLGHLVHYRLEYQNP